MKAGQRTRKAGVKSTKSRVLASLGKQAYNIPESRISLQIDSAVTNRYKFLKQLPLFAEVPRANLERLAQHFVVRSYKPHQTIFFQGDVGQMMYLVQSGKVRIYMVGGDGQEISLVLYGPGSIFGELALIDELPRSATAVAMEDTVVLTLSRDRWQEMRLRSPQIDLNFMKALSARLRETNRQVQNLTVLSVRARVAFKLMELAAEYGVEVPEGVRLNVTLTQAHLASLINATRESTNKALSVFKRQGLVLTEGGNITITDLDVLREQVKE